MKTKLSLLCLSFLMLPAFAGQFDYIYAGKAASYNPELMKVWRQYFPGLESKIEKAFADAKISGEYLFDSDQSPVDWNITADKGVSINSINSGYYMNYRNPNNYRPLFPGLKADEQGVDITTGGSLLVSPHATESGGFGYAVTVSHDTEMNLRAGKKIVLMSTYSSEHTSYQDELAIAVSDDGTLNMNAEDIFIFGAVDAQYGAVINMNASGSINFLQPTDSDMGESFKTPVRLITADMNLSAGDIFFNRPVQVGMIFLGTNHPSDLVIQDNPNENIQVNRVYFNKPVSIEKSSSLTMQIAGTTVFNKRLSLIADAQANITALGVRVKEIWLGNLGAKAVFNIRDNGSMYVEDEIKVGINSELDINLGQRSALRAEIDTVPKGTSTISMAPESFWFPVGSSSLTKLKLSEHSIVDMGEPNEAMPITVNTLEGDGGVLWYRPEAQGILNILNHSEGAHSVLLGSTGRSISETNYLFHKVAVDGSQPADRKAVFYLENKGLVEAGPYQYKLGLNDFSQGDDRVWLITAAQQDKPVPVPPEESVSPDEPDTPGETVIPPVPDEPSPPLTFNPDDPATIPPDLIPEPVGLSESAKLVLAAVGQGTQVSQYLGALSELRQRLGEIRLNYSEDVDGAYVLFRYDQSRISFYQDVNGKLKNFATAVGVNRKISPNVIVGADLDIGYSRLKVNDFGKGKVNSNSIGARGYLTWFNQFGTYADFVLTFNHYNNRLSTQMLDEATTSAKYSNIGAGVSAEVGHQLQFLNKGDNNYFYIEPQIQLSSYWLKGKDFSLNNGMRVSVKDGKSLTGRVGIDIGKNFLIADKKPAQVYLRGGVRHEFLGKTKAQLNEFNFEDKSLGTRAYYGVGFEVRAKDRVKLYAQLNRESGHRIKTDVQVRFGASIFF